MGAYIYSNYGLGMTQKNLSNATTATADSAARLSSGMRVVSGKFGGADIAYAELGRTSVFTANANARNESFNMSKLQRVDNFLENVLGLLSRANEAAITAATVGTNGAASTATYSTEISQLFSAANALITAASGVGATGVTLASMASATSAATIQGFINTVSDYRATAGALAAGKEFIITAYESDASLAEDARGKFISVDYAAEAANLTRNQILQQAAAAMVAQTNQSANFILALFK